MLSVYTVNDEFVFSDEEDVQEVYKAINNAGARGAEWSIPIELKNGKRITFILKNIIAIEID